MKPNHPISFYVSTTAFRRTPVETVVEKAREAGLALEFSSGLPYRADMKDFYLACTIKRLPHNYFPAPAEPFVLNLASSNEEIRLRSVQHCKQGIELSAASGAPFFSAHAGFCIDPHPKELGRQLSVDDDFDIAENLKLFAISLKELLHFAQKRNVTFLIENNVIAKFNLSESGRNPLLCATPEECVQIIQEINHPHLGLLLDTGHLKVSADTLEFDGNRAVNTISKYVQCIHHSDNDGKADTNLAFNKSYWFLKHMPLFTHSAHVLEVHDQSIEQIYAQRDLLNQAAFTGAQK